MNPDTMDDAEYTRVAGQLWYVLRVTGNLEEKNGVLNFVK